MTLLVDRDKHTSSFLSPSSSSFDLVLFERYELLKFAAEILRWIDIERKSCKSHEYFLGKERCHDKEDKKRRNEESARSTFLNSHLSSSSSSSSALHSPSLPSSSSSHSPQTPSFSFSSSSSPASPKNLHIPVELSSSFPSLHSPSLPSPSSSSLASSSLASSSFDSLLLLVISRLYTSFKSLRYGRLHTEGDPSSSFSLSASSPDPSCISRLSSSSSCSFLHYLDASSIVSLASLLSFHRTRSSSSSSSFRLSKKEEERSQARVNSFTSSFVSSQKKDTGVREEDEEEEKGLDPTRDKKEEEEKRKKDAKDRQIGRERREKRIQEVKRQQEKEISQVREKEKLERSLEEPKKSTASSSSSSPHTEGSGVSTPPSSLSTVSSCSPLSSQRPSSSLSSSLLHSSSSSSLRQAESQATPCYKLYVRGISRSWDEESLLSTFSHYGRVLQLRKKGGYAFVTFSSFREGETARKELHGTTNGCREKRRLYIHWAQTSSCFSSNQDEEDKVEDENEEEEERKRGEEDEEEGEKKLKMRERQISSRHTQDEQDLSPFGGRRSHTDHPREEKKKEREKKEEREKEKGKIDENDKEHLERKVKKENERGTKSEENRQRNSTSLMTSRESKSFLRVKLLYISRFIKLLQGGQLKLLPLLKLIARGEGLGGLKEITESFAVVKEMLAACKKIQIRRGKEEEEEGGESTFKSLDVRKCRVHVFIPGDGKVPRTAAAVCVHTPESWTCTSIDPRILGENEETRLYGDLAGRRIQCVRSFSQDFNFLSSPLLSSKKGTEKAAKKDTDEDEEEVTSSSLVVQKDSSLQSSSSSFSSSSLSLSRGARETSVEAREEKEEENQKKEEEEEERMTGNVDLCVVLSVHSHAPLEDFFRRMQRVFDARRLCRYGYLCITLPCCGSEGYLTSQKAVRRFIDESILSECREILTYYASPSHLQKAAVVFGTGESE